MKELNTGKRYSYRLTHIEGDKWQQAEILHLWGAMSGFSEVVETITGTRQALMQSRKGRFQYVMNYGDLSGLDTYFHNDVMKSDGSIVRA